MKKMFVIGIMFILAVSSVGAEQFVDAKYISQSGKTLTTDMGGGDFTFLPSGSSVIKIQFTNKAGVVYNEPFLGSDGSVYKLGRYSGSTWYLMHVNENIQVNDEDYFVVSKKGYTRILQYKDIVPGASTTDNSGTFKVKDVGTGDVLSVSYADLEGNLQLDGNVYKIKVSADANGATLQVDMDGNGAFYLAGEFRLYSNSGASLSIGQMSGDFDLLIDSSKVKLRYKDQSGASQSFDLFCINADNMVSMCYSATVCSESDIRLQYYEKGYVKMGGSEIQDYCSGSLLFEWSCFDVSEGDEYSQIQKNIYECPYGCSDGACKPFSECVVVGTQREPSTMTYTVGDYGEYEVEVPYISGTDVKFRVNGELTDTLGIGQQFGLPGPVDIRLLDTMRKGFYDYATFCLERSDEIPPAECSDSDGGETDYLTKGYVETAGQKTWDRCESFNHLIEYYCLGSEVKHNVKYCANGCRDGACLKTLECDITDTLNEGETKVYTVNSREYEIQASYIGSTEVKMRVNGRLTDSLKKGDTDVIADESRIQNLDFYYSNGGTDTVKFCFKAGLTTSAICTDSDNGLNYNVKGTTVKGANSKTDYCDDYRGYNLIEYICQDNDVVWKGYVCPSGCKDGACLQVGAVEPVRVEEIHNFKVEQGNFKFDVFYIFNDWYIDGRKVQASLGYLSGVAHTAYKIKCEEGKKLYAKFYNPISGDLTAEASKDISRYDCAEEVEEEEEEPVPAPWLPPTPILPEVEPGECKTDADCDDGNACTADVCSGSPRKCTQRIQSGCNFDGSCLPIGIRTADVYCDINGKMVHQKGADVACSNNYECVTNLCLDGQCLEPGFFRNLLLWFKSFFGFE